MLTFIMDVIPAHTSDYAGTLELLWFALQTIGFMFGLGGLIFLAIHLSNRRAGKKRYAALQARKAADGTLGVPSSITLLANEHDRPQFIDDADAGIPPMPNQRKDQILNG